MVYKIWGKRNLVVWENICVIFEKVIERVLKEVSDRIRYYLFKKISNRDRNWLNDIGFLKEK